MSIERGDSLSAMIALQSQIDYLKNTDTYTVHALEALLARYEDRCPDLVAEIRSALKSGGEI